MAISYSSNGYVQQPFGNSAATTSSFLTPLVWNKILHEQVQNKLFWKDMIGKDKGGEGSIESDVLNSPIVEKTDLRKESGDTITMGLVKQPNLADETTITYMNYGKVNSQQLVDNEASLTFYYLRVPVAHFRDAILIQSGKMTDQRSPYALMSQATSLLSTRLAKVKDDGVFTAFYAGYSFNVWRGNDLTGVAHPNNLYGKNKSALTDVDANDVVDTDLLERLAVFGKVNNIGPVSIEGSGCYGFTVHPYGMKTLRADSLWKDAAQLALPRSKENPIFTRADGKYSNIYVMEDNRVSTAKNYAVASSSNSIGAISASTVGSGISATDVRMNIFFGANAIARGVAQEEYMARRKEDDYGNMVGFGGGYIYGDRRADWAPDQSSSTTAVNQSSAIIWSHSPNPNSNVSSIW